MIERSRIKVLYVVGSLEVGGAERQIVELCRRLDRERFSPEIATMGLSGAMASLVRERGIPVHALRSTHVSQISPRDPRRVWNAVRAVGRLRALIRRRSPEILHAFLPESCAVAAVAVGRRRRPSLIVAKRSLVRSIAAAPLFLPMTRFANRRARVIHVNSDAVGGEMVAREGGAREKVRLIYNGVDTAVFRPPDDASARPRARIGMLANFLPYKGHREAVEALDQVCRDFPAVELWLWGRDGASSPGVKELCRVRGLEDRVRFFGMAHDPADALRQMGIFLSASHEEGFSNSILEAMATGLPVVATSVGGTTEQIEHGQTGLLVPPGDSQALSEALRALLSDEALASRLGSAARWRAVNHFSVERMIHEMAGLYEELAAKL